MSAHIVGKRVCQVEQGNVPKFSCPFHGWQFHTDGALASITDEETYDADLIAHRPGLTEIRCETIGGLIFINMDGNAPPLKEWIGLPEGSLLKITKSRK